MTNDNHKKQLEHLFNGKTAAENYAEIVRERQKALKKMLQEQKEKQQAKKDEK